MAIEDDDNDDILHVHDLPQLYQRPSAAALLRALNLLSILPLTFSTASTPTSRKPRVHETGIPAYLTTIIASSLAWIPDDDCREQIWDAASLRLSERSGRAAMPAMTRAFQITDDLTVALHEPSLTGDNLGLKTWAAALLLARRLARLKDVVIPEGRAGVRVLELGSGTGLVGISAACLWGVEVVLTDLKEIVPNLRRNLGLNEEVVNGRGGSVDARSLDWADSRDEPKEADDKFGVIVVADPIYSPEHPKILVAAVQRWLKYLPDSRVIIELPLRPHYVNERADLQALLRSIALEPLVTGKEIGEDDWLDEDGNAAQVECEWTVWRPR